MHFRGLIEALALLILIAALGQSSGVPQARGETATGAATPEGGYVSMDKLPFREAWYGIYFQEDKVGFSHLKIEPLDQNFSINTDSVLRLKALKKVSEIRTKDRVVVRPDLTLASFQSVVLMNGKEMTMIGRTDGDRFVADITLDGEKTTREFPLDGKVYHSSLISLIPALRGLRDGQTYIFDVFSAEKQATQQVNQKISLVKGPSAPNGAVWKVESNIGRSVVHSWLDEKGLTVLEKAVEGSLITRLEDESAAQKFVDQKVLGKDLILDVSLIRILKPLPPPEKLQFFKARLEGIERSLIPEDHRQKISAGAKWPQDRFNIAVQVEDVSRFKVVAQRQKADVFDAYLAPTISNQSDHKEIVNKANEIVSASDSLLEKVTKLSRWVSENIKNGPNDSFTALAVLRSKEGGSQSRAALYTALARSQGIPTRMVTGIVYSSNPTGFLYHAWCESYLNAWLAIDPTFKQIPADPTHIKMALYDSGDTQTPLKMIGKVKLEVLEYR